MPARIYRFVCLVNLHAAPSSMRKTLYGLQGVRIGMTLEGWVIPLKVSKRNLQIILPLGLDSLVLFLLVIIQCYSASQTGLNCPFQSTKTSKKRRTSG